VLKSYYLKQPSLESVRRWVKTTGFMYDCEKKSFYVDGHEKAEQKYNRGIFCEKYLLSLELRTHPWVQFKSDEINNGRISSKGSYVALNSGFKVESKRTPTIC